MADGGPVLRKLVMAAIVRNPYAGRFSEDLSLILDPSPALGQAFARRMQATLGGSIPQSHGKAALVGTGGEIEHGKAFLTTAFANQLRDAFHASAWVPSTVKMGLPGTSIDIPLACNDALYVGSHEDTISLQFGDAPRRDEVVVLFAVASRGRIQGRPSGLLHEERTGDGLR